MVCSLSRDLCCRVQSPVFQTMVDFFFFFLTEQLLVFWITRYVSGLLNLTLCSTPSVRSSMPLAGVPVLLHARWRPCPSVADVAQLWCSPSVIGCWCAFRKTLCTSRKRVTVITFRSSLPSPDPCLQRRLCGKELVGRNRLSVSILGLNSSYKPQTARESSLKVSGVSLPQSGWFFLPPVLKDWRQPSILFISGFQFI